LLGPSEKRAQIIFQAFQSIVVRNINCDHARRSWEM
jgi:hypothetical protein